MNFNRFNTNSYYPIDSFKYFDDYVEIISNGQKYKSYNKIIKTVLNNFKLIDNKFYCNYFNQKSEVEIGIRTYNNRKFKNFKNKYTPAYTYIEQTLEVHIKDKGLAAYYLNFTEPHMICEDQVFVNILCLNKKFYFEDTLNKKRIYYKIPNKIFYSKLYNLLDENTRIKIKNLKQNEELYCYIQKDQYISETWIYDSGKESETMKVTPIPYLFDENGNIKGNDDKNIINTCIYDSLILAQITPLKE